MVESMGRMDEVEAEKELRRLAKLAKMSWREAEIAGRTAGRKIEVAAGNATLFPLTTRPCLYLIVKITGGVLNSSSLFLRRPVCLGVPWRGGIRVQSKDSRSGPSKATRSRSTYKKSNKQKRHHQS